MNEKPLVTIMTPVRYTSMQLLRRALASVRAQTYGTDRIEWLVVVHNTDDDYVSQVEELLSDAPFACVTDYRKGNSNYYPRNEALRRMRGKYLFFLDSDDYLDEHVVKDTVEAMEKTQADTAVFDVEVQFGNGLRQDIVLHLNVDKSSDCVLYYGGDPRIEYLLCGCAICLWCRCYRTDFLKENRFFFKEDHSFGDDIFFCVQTTLAAKKVIALPKLRGYVWCTHEGSTFQSVVTDEDRFAEILERSEQVFEMAYEFGARLGILQAALSFGQIRRVLALDIEQEMKQAYIRRIGKRMRNCTRLFPYGAFQEKDVAVMRALIRSATGSDPNGKEVKEYHSHTAVLPYLLSEEDLKLRLSEAVSENPALSYYSRSGRISTERADLRNRGFCAEVNGLSDGQKQFIESYRNLEKLRGFNEPEEIPCRVTVFQTGDQNCAVLITFESSLCSPAMEKRFAERLIHPDNPVFSAR